MNRNLTLLLFLSLVNCGLLPFGNNSNIEEDASIPTDSDTPTDGSEVGPDAELDAGPPDATPDTGPDSTPDTDPDTTPNRFLPDTYMTSFFMPASDENHPPVDIWYSFNQIDLPGVLRYEVCITTNSDIEGNEDCPEISLLNLEENNYGYLENMPNGDRIPHSSEIYFGIRTIGNVGDGPKPSRFTWLTITTNDSLLREYNFDGTTEDSSRHAIHAVYEGEDREEEELYMYDGDTCNRTIIGEEFPTTDGIACFDGRDRRINLGNHETLDQPEMTFQIRGSFNRGFAAGTILDNLNSLTPGSDGYQWALNSEATAITQLFNSVAPSYRTETLTPGALNLYHLTHLIGFQGIYVNASEEPLSPIEEAPGRETDPIIDNGLPLIFGSDVQYNDEGEATLSFAHMTAIIDRLRIFSGDLSQPVRLSHYCTDILRTTGSPDPICLP